MRYWRPLMLTLTWAMGEFPLPPPYPPPRAGEGREGGSIPVGRNDRPDGAHRLVDPAHRLAIAAFKLAGARPRHIKFRRQPRSIDVEDVNLLGKRTAAASVAESLLQDGIERIKRIDHTFDGVIESARAVRHAFWPGHVLTASVWSPFRPPVVNLTVIVNRASTQTPVPGGVLPSLSGSAGAFPPPVRVLRCAPGRWGGRNARTLGMRLRPCTLVGASAFVPKLADAPPFSPPQVQGNRISSPR